MEVLYLIDNNTLVTNKAVQFEAIDTNKLGFDSVVSHPLHIAVLAMVLLRRKI